MRVKVINKKPVKIWTERVEHTAMQQITNLTKLPFLYHHLAIMPDVHAGMGMPIGGVLACVDTVIPNAVGVDIGCGMCAVKTNWKASQLSRKIIIDKILTNICNCIPVGMNHHPKAQDTNLLPQGHDIERMEVVSHRYAAIHHEIGTLGGGNHFIELQRDEEDNLWIMIHSGSRNLGKQVGDHYNKLASRLNRLWHADFAIDINMPFLPVGSKEFNDYWREMQYCIDFAFCNRKLMMDRIKGILADTLIDIEFEPMINIAHNYAAWENHFKKNVIVHRKGATLARKGTIGIIPGSQGTASYIVEGLGNPESFCSCSHGAGRRMSRKEAIRKLDLAAEQRRLDNLGVVHSMTSQNKLDEAASAYKNIDTVLRNEMDLVKIVTKLMPIAVVKG